jgi:hypothetical protein
VLRRPRVRLPGGESRAAPPGDDRTHQIGFAGLTPWRVGYTPRAAERCDASNGTGCPVRRCGTGRKDSSRVILEARNTRQGAAGAHDPKDATAHQFMCGGSLTRLPNLSPRSAFSRWAHRGSGAFGARMGSWAAGPISVLSAISSCPPGCRGVASDLAPAPRRIAVQPTEREAKCGAMRSGAELRGGWAVLGSNQ